jgi:hypothetical protein
MTKRSYWWHRLPKAKPLARGDLIAKHDNKNEDSEAGIAEEN